MKTLKLSVVAHLVLVGVVMAATLAQAANTFWTGPTNTFTHDSFSSTVDQLTTNHIGADAVNNVWLTRGTSHPLYNAAAESSWNGSTSPVNTQWAVASGPLTSAASLTYDTFDNVVGQPGNSPGNSVGKTFYVKIVSDNIYLVLTLTAWGNNNGGSFTYQRSTPAVTPPSPTISITNPVSGAVFVAPANVNLAASAAVSGGTVTNVQFFTNGVFLKSVQTPPFRLTVTNLGAGAYVLKAVAVAAGISATSAVVNITVVSPPSVSITNPVNGTVLAAPANVNIAANATVNNGIVTNVQFFTNGVSLGSVPTAPFSLTANNLGAGAYALTAVATAAGISATSAVVNIAIVSSPTVSITNPASGAVFPAPANVPIAADAVVSGGTVTNVEFFTNGISLGSVPTAPFSLTASNLVAGTYALTAVATAAGISATSTVVSITVGAAPPPTVSITNPAVGAVFAAPANVNIAASATVGGGAVTNVQFFTNGAPAGSVATPPFSLTASNLTAGSYSLAAVATASGISATSSVVNISVVNPVTVSLSGVSLRQGQFYFNYDANPGLAYVVLSSSNLLNWVPLVTNIAPSDPVLFSNAVNAAGANYFRVGLLPNP